MFDYFGTDAATVHILEQTQTGKWLTNRKWALLYPISLMGPSELLLKSGRYRVADKGKWEYFGDTDVRMSTMLPVITKDKHNAIILTRKAFYGHPITIDFRPPWRKAEVKCYILDTSDEIIEAKGPGIIVRKMYYDRIKKLYPEALIQGSNKDASLPVLFTDRTGVRGGTNIVGVIMPMNYGNAKEEARAEVRFDQWVPDEAEPTDAMEVGNVD